jgi:hypothetical protein
VCLSHVLQLHLELAALTSTLRPTPDPIKKAGHEPGHEQRAKLAAATPRSYEMHRQPSDFTLLVSCGYAAASQAGMQ